MERRTIALFGSSQTQPGEPLYELAYEIGRRLGTAGLDLINGGHEGTMAASARGVVEAGGRVTGVTCGPIRGARDARLNRSSQRMIDAPTLLARIEVMLRRAGGYVVLEGGTGTLAELGLAWEHVHKGLLQHRPMVCAGEFWRPVVEAAVRTQPDARRSIRFANTAEQVAEIMMREAIAVEPAEAEFLGPAVYMEPAAFREGDE